MPTDTALHKAANSGDLDAVLNLFTVVLELNYPQELVDEHEERVDVNAPGAGDRRPIHRAAGANHADIIKILIEKGAVVDQVLCFWEFA